MQDVLKPRTFGIILLNFTTYELCGYTKQIELGIHLEDFDYSKLSVAKCEVSNNLHVLYDGKAFRIFIKDFSGIVKRSRRFRREKHIKVKDSCVSRLLREIFWNIEELVRKYVIAEKQFCWFTE